MNFFPDFVDLADLANLADQCTTMHITVHLLMPPYYSVPADAPYLLYCLLLAGPLVDEVGRNSDGQPGIQTEIYQ